MRSEGVAFSTKDGEQVLFDIHDLARCKAFGLRTLLLPLFLHPLAGSLPPSALDTPRIVAMSLLHASF
jgi:hypothetical protein